MATLTCNQAMLLLQIHRGTLDKEFKIGTFAHDFEHLVTKGFVEVAHDRFFTTWGGARLVKHMLLLPD